MLPHPPPPRCLNCGAAAGPAKAGELREARLPGADADVVLPVRVLGGCGVPLAVGAAVGIRFTAERVVFVTEKGAACDVPSTTLQDIAIGGPGFVTSGGGFIGGGFGLAGFVQGVALASILNKVTTSSQIVTVVAIMGDGWEVHGLNTVAEPGALRIQLAPVFTRLRAHACTT
jgi:hypothetical protein